MPLGTLISLIALVVFFISYMIVRFFNIKIAAIIFKCLTSLSFVMIAVFSKEKMLFDNFAYGLTIGALSLGCASDIVIQFRRYSDNNKTKFLPFSFFIYFLQKYSPIDIINNNIQLKRNLNKQFKLHSIFRPFFLFKIFFIKKNY
jgi:hypothetical protein